MEKKDIKSMLPQELTEFTRQLSQPDYRAKQIFSWLQSGVESFDEMTDLPAALRKTLQETCYIATAQVEKKFRSKLDGTVKYLYRLRDGELIESVLMHYEHGYTVCVSTQVGCRMGCTFCASGKSGFIRNLTASEILSQIFAAQRDQQIRVSHVVMMGIGEPMDNFESTVRFLQLVSHPSGLNISLRHISVSTSGVVPGIRRLAEYRFPITLSISLHAPNDAIRSRTMPVNRKWNIASLLEACREYQAATTRRISFEYALIEGVNDSPECARQLSKILNGILAHINLIPANPVVETSFRKPSRERIVRFQKMLEGFGFPTTIRRTLGADINASCGQLRRKTLQEKEDAR